MGKNKAKRRGSTGSFFLGGFVGFLCCLLTIAGVLAFVYYKVTPNWINKTFKTEIDLGSDGANKMTLDDLVSNAIGLVNNFDNYKLSSLEKDFGIKISNDFMGIDISDLKDVEMSKLSEAVENKFANISATELNNISAMNLENTMGPILDKTNTYYYNSNKLYKDKEYSKEVDFEYKINSDKTKVLIKKEEYPIVLNKISVILWNLPLTSAFGDFMSNMGDNITLADLEDDFGVELPSFMNNIDKANTTVNELESAINGLLVADFLGYAIDKSDPDNVIVRDGGTVVKGVLATLAQYTIENLEQGVNDLTLSDLFAEDERTGVLSLIDNPDKVTLTGQTDASKGILSISDALTKVIEVKNLGQLADAGLINCEDFEEMRTKWIDIDLTPLGTNYVHVQDLKLNELLDLSLTILYDVGLLLDNKPTN